MSFSACWNQILEAIETDREKKPECKLKIEPMTECLHGMGCNHLDAPGERSPLCGWTGQPIFDLRQCPLGKWWFP